MLGMALVTGLSGVPTTSMTESNPYTVEAKKLVLKGRVFTIHSRGNWHHFFNNF